MSAASERLDRIEQALTALGDQMRVMQDTVDQIAAGQFLLSSDGLGSAVNGRRPPMPARSARSNPGRGHLRVVAGE